MTYKIIRQFRNSSCKSTIARGLTLAEAQSHCKDPETSSSKATTPEALRRTRLYGPWFDGYEQDGAN